MSFVWPLADGLPWWGVVAIGTILLWIAIPVNTMWRCRNCGRVMWGNHLHKVAFCLRCGVPRPRGPAGVPIPLTVEAKHGIAGEIRDRVRDILIAENLAAALPAGTKAKAMVVAEIEEGTTIAFAHPTWKPEAVDGAAHLPPYARRHALETVPGGIVLVEIDAVERASGGMSSHFGFEGIFVSLLVSLGERKIWDARATDAT